MRIDPITAGSGYQSYIRPLNYPVGNASDTSSGYSESVRRNGGKYSVGAVAPVKYADSQTVGPGPKKGSEKARKMEQAFNKIASDHYGETVLYGSKGEGFGYEAEGRIFDAFT
jgi:hypothetical protein